MLIKTRQHIAGFTIVELLIVIVVIAILASISIVSYNGIQQRARNLARTTESTQTMKLFELYAAFNGDYPDIGANVQYCIGKNFPNEKCRGFYGDISSPYTYDATDSTMTDMLETVGSTSANHTPINNSLVGPYVESYGDVDWYRLIVPVEGESASDCAPSTTFSWNDPNSDLLICYKTYHTKT